MLTVIELAECRLALDAAGYNAYAIKESEHKPSRHFALKSDEGVWVGFYYHAPDGDRGGGWRVPITHHDQSSFVGVMMIGEYEMTMGRREDDVLMPTPAAAVNEWARRTQDAVCD